MRYVEAPLGEGEGGVVGSLDQRSQVYREFSSALTTLDRAENPVTPWLTTKHTETKREQDTNAYVYHIRVYTI